MFTVNFVAMDRQGDWFAEQVAGQWASCPEAVWSFLELFGEEKPFGTSAFVVGPAGIAATLTEVKRASSPGWSEIVIVGPSYPDGERWEVRWVDGEFLKRRISADVAVLA
jgi:hypothetical protein